MGGSVSSAGTDGGGAGAGGEGLAADVEAAVEVARRPSGRECEGTVAPRGGGGGGGRVAGDRAGGGRRVAADSVELLKLLLEKREVSLTKGADNVLLENMERLVGTGEWYSGRSVETLSKRLVRSASASDASTATVTRDMLLQTIEGMMKGKERPTTSKERKPPGPPTCATAGSSRMKPPPQVNVAAPSCAQQSAAENEDEAEFERAGGSKEGNLLAALKKACVDLGYDKTQEKRKELIGLLESVHEEGLPKDILQHVIRATGASAEKVNKALHPQVPTVLSAIKAAMQGEEERLAELARMEEEERQRAIAKEVEVQAKLQRCGKCCAGFRWLREGSGWRCAGGSHYITDRELDQVP